MIARLKGAKSCVHLQSTVCVEIIYLELYIYNFIVQYGDISWHLQGGLVFVCGTADGIIKVSGRRHNCDDLKATILAVDPIKFVFRGRLVSQNYLQITWVTTPVCSQLEW